MPFPPVLWEDSTKQTGLVDLVQQQLVRRCRDKLLPSLGKWAMTLAGIHEFLGTEREELAMEVVVVESREERIAKDM